MSPVRSLDGHEVPMWKEVAVGSLGACGMGWAAKIAELVRKMLRMMMLVLELVARAGVRVRAELELGR